MLIRSMTADDAAAVSAVCMRSFSHSVANSLAAAGALTFATIASAEAFLKRLQEDNVILVATDETQIMGVVELRAGSHVSMFFVDPEYQKQGIGKQLLHTVLERAQTDDVTVNASLYSVPVYRKSGFECRGDVAEHAGLTYQPMVLHLHTAAD